MLGPGKLSIRHRDSRITQAPCGQGIAEYGAELPVLSSRPLLIIYFIYSSVCMCVSPKLLIYLHRQHQEGQTGQY